MYKRTYTDVCQRIWNVHDVCLKYPKHTKTYASVVAQCDCTLSSNISIARKYFDSLLVSDYTRSATEAQGRILKTDNKLEPNEADVSGQLNRKFDLEVFEHRDKYGKVFSMSDKHLSCHTTDKCSLRHISGRTI